MRYSIERDEVLRYLGYTGQAIEPSLFGRIDEIIEACETELAPKDVVASFDIDARATAEAARRGDPRVVLAGCSLALPGSDIAAHLAGAHACALMACTLGAKSERAIARLNAVNPLDALIYDSACSALVERAADAVEARIVEAAASQGWHTNFRYSPGYGDLPLDVQPELLAVLRAYETIGLSVTPSNLLVPTKSITAIVGLFEQPPATDRTRQCTTCAMKDFCALRASGRTCYGR